MLSAKKELFTRPSGGYQISRSVRLRSSASAYFNRTLTTPTNNKIFTISAWVKRGLLSTSANHQILAGYVPATSFDSFFIGGSASYTDKLVYLDNTAGYLVSTQVFRDPSAWYHVMAAVDTTQATASNRVKLYVNGTQITSFSTASYPSLNQAVIFNSAVAHTLGSFGYNSTAYFDGYMTEFNFIDGQQLTPSSFGETNAVTGVWQPKKYGGTYGNNGFYLNFSDNSGVTATTIGKDYSGNGNNWTPSAGISITAGVTYDSMLDVPTLTDANTANYCVLNPLNNTGTTASANLNWNGTDKAILSTIAFPTTGKYYFEATCSTVANFSIIGIVNSAIYASAFNGVISSANFRTYNSGGEKADSTRTASWGSTFTNNDIIGVAVDMDNGAIYFAKNNTWQASGVPTSGASKTGAAFTDLTSSGLTWTPFFGATNINGVWIANFGQRPFTYTPPTGFKALNTQNLPDATIKKGSSYFDVVLWTGDNTTSRSITGVGFAPDFVWAKCRSASYDHALYDAVRGSGTSKYLISNTTGAEGQYSNLYGSLSSFNSDGFSVATGTDAGNPNAFFNESSKTYVAWNWNAGGSTVTNTSGTISSQVRANPTAGFSVVTYTGTGANATVGHGLNATPAMIIVKNRDSGAIGGAVYHTSLGATKYLKLFQTTTGSDNEATDNTAWNGGSPTFNSSVFSVGSLNRTNSSQQMVAYCFAAVSGYSAFGKYTGNGVPDGPFVFLGFRPRFVLFKRTDAANDWVIHDSSRNTFNVVDDFLKPNLSNAEGTYATSGHGVDFLSSGMKLRTDSGQLNASTGTYIYAAFAENPFKLSLAR